jgi:predicted acyl esterase
MSDGVRLAATLYLPETEPPWPVVLEALPYRKDDLSNDDGTYRRVRDEGNYAVCRVDLRGTGTSEGIAAGEYLAKEQDDLCEVIEWLARQESCSGSVGMFGTSYSGFNAIQTAMRRPPALKAIISIFATDDRYTDDIHFGGGIRKAVEFGYPLFMVSENALPPVPSLAGDGWREAWLHRIDEVVPWFDSIEQQKDGPFWRQGSLRPNYDLISVPTMIVAGWADVYRNSALRMIEHLQVPKRLLMGPWCHMWPTDSIPGPHIDFIPEMLRWWDRWLRGARNGVDEEPPIAMFIQRSTTPQPDLAEMRGEWRFEPAWPPTRMRESSRSLTDAEGGARRDGDEETLVVRGDVGTTAHIRGSYEPPYGLPIDQRPDEAMSLPYEWPVQEELEILGNPRLEATVRSSRPVAFLSAKLSEVLPDGTSALVSRGILNLTHRSSHSRPEPLVPGELYEVSLEMDATSRVFEAKSRMRLAIAGSDWPNAWAPPYASELTIVPGRTRLVLPTVAGGRVDAAAPSFRPAPDVATARQEPPVWRIEHDVYARETRVVVHQTSRGQVPGVSTWWRNEDVRVGVNPFDPGTSWVESMDEVEVAFAEVSARAKARLELRSDETTYFFDLVLHVYENDELIRQRRWQRETPRLLQ